MAGDDGPLLERYGMTEIGMALRIRCTANGVRMHRRAAGVEIRLVDGPVRHWRADATGKSVRGRACSQYVAPARDTARAFRDGWFRTGDMARLDQGAYRILGRTSVTSSKPAVTKSRRSDRGRASHASVDADFARSWRRHPSGASACRPPSNPPGAALRLDDLQQWVSALPMQVPKA